MNKTKEKYRNTCTTCVCVCVYMINSVYLWRCWSCCCWRLPIWRSWKRRRSTRWTSTRWRQADSSLSVMTGGSSSAPSDDIIDVSCNSVYTVSVSSAFRTVINFYRAACNAAAVLWWDLCPSVRLSVCPSVCLSHAWIVTKRKKNLSRFIYHTKEHLS